jgi:hypothetical protein
MSKTQTGSSKLGLVLLIVVAIGAAMFYSNSMGESEEFYQYPGPDEERRNILLIVGWNNPVNREITISYWIDGYRHAGLPDEGHDEGDWRTTFWARPGEKVELLAENVSRGGDLGCFILDEAQMVRRKLRRQDLGDCRLTHIVGDPPNLEEVP